MIQYLDLLSDVLDNGEKRPDRTGTGTLSLFGRQVRYDLSDGFPAVTTKKLFMKGVIEELLWFLRGETNIKTLQEAGVNIWDAWSKKDTSLNRQKIPVWIKKSKSLYSPYLGDYSSSPCVKAGSKDDMLRNIWIKMMKRCYSVDSHNYPFYGGSGVSVSKKWHNCSVFISDAKNLAGWDNKEREWKEYELDKDYYSSSVYSLETCIWLSSSENNIYTRNFSPFKIRLGEELHTCLSYSDASLQTGIPTTTLHRWRTQGLPSTFKGENKKYRNIEIEEIKEREEESLRWSIDTGDLGPVYGHQWRSWNSEYEDPHWKGSYVRSSIDQIANVIRSIKGYPYSRRHIVSAWNVADLDDMALVPCHLLFQFYVSNGKLSCQLYQRSGDLFLGVPFNIASYALLTHMIAQVCDLEVGDFVHTIGDAHIYENHVDQVKEQLSRVPKQLPQLILNPDVRSIDSFSIDDIELKNYNYHPSIKAKVAV